MPVVLAIDTALNNCSAAVYSDAGKASETQPMMQGHAEHLVPMIERVIVEAGLKHSDLIAVVTTVGPGAFTGLRIGLSTARATAMALEIPLYGMTTTQLLALQYGAEVAVILETKREDFYFQTFDTSGKVSCEAASLPASEIVEMLGDKDWTIVGDGVERFQKAAVKDFKTSPVNIPDMAFMAELFAKQPRLFTEGGEPVYLRGADVSQSKRKNRIFEGITG